MEQSFSTLSGIIKKRRSIKPANMNGRSIPDEQIIRLLELANWAPNHANTEPWRFMVYAGTKAKTFCARHAELYKQNVAPEQFMQSSYDKLLHNGDHVSHIIVAIMQRGNLSKIPVVEEIAATAAAIQNLLLGAESLGIATLWSTGGLTHHPALKHLLELREEDMVIGILFMGYTDTLPIGKRIVPLEEKVVWKR